MTKDQLKPLLAELMMYHAAFPGGVEWQLTSQGIKINGAGIERTYGEPATVARVWKNFGDSIQKWADELVVPVELIVATICTETGGNPNAVRKEPGYASDYGTPSRVSAGLMQTLISTAREVVGKRGIDRNWLLAPDNAIMAGASYIKKQAGATDFDPPKVACAYNAGGVYRQDGARNRWKMRQFPLGTGEHCDRFVKWFNDFYYLVERDGIQLNTSFFNLLRE